jgi:iron complex transport system ATP-binding protein
MSNKKNSSIHTQSLQAAYKEQLLYSDVNLHLELGQLYGLVGNNGTGKSTLLKQIAGILPCDKKSIFYGQKDIATLSAKDKAKERFYIHAASFSNKRINVVDCLSLAMQDNRLFFGSLSPLQNNKIDESLSYFSIQKLKNKLLSEISDGEFQKVLLCMAYVSDCPIILLDEPTAYLDFNTKLNTFKLLKHWCEEKQKCVIIATHDIYQLMEVTSELLGIENQRITSITPEKLKSNLNVT